MAKSHDKVKGPTREGDYLILDEVTGLQIYASDAIVDFWGRVTCPEWEAKPSPMEYMDTSFPTFTPTFGRKVPDPVDQVPTWFVKLNSSGDVTSIWYSDNYSPGFYTPATGTQINNYVPVVNDQTFSYSYDGSDATHTVATLSATDVTGYGLSWEITEDTSGAFSIDSSTGVLYVAFMSAITADTDYTLTVKATSYFPGAPFDTATITVEVSGLNAAPYFIGTTSFSIPENTTDVGTVVAVDPEGTALTYSIVGGADQACFTIGSSTGTISFTSAPDYESPGDAGGNNVYNLTVRAVDIGLAGANQSVTVTVTDVVETPEDYGSMVLWLDFSDNTTITANTGQCVSISNKVTSATDNFTASTAGFRPDLVTTKFGGKQAAYFNTQDRLNSSRAANFWNFLADGTGSTMIAAIHTRSTTTASSFALMGNSSGTAYDYIFNHGPVSGGSPRRFSPIIAGTTTSTPNNTWALDTGYVIALVTQSTGTQVELFLDGVSVATGALGSDTGDATSALALGQANDSSSASSIWYLAELWIYDEALSGTTLTDAIDMMATRNGL